MRAVLATHGTMGDDQPLPALALELERRGHGVKTACRLIEQACGEPDGR